MYQAGATWRVTAGAEEETTRRPCISLAVSMLPLLLLCLLCLVPQELLDGSGLGHVTHLTRTEWSVLRGALGCPRRLSLNFLRQERQKLEAYRYEDCFGGGPVVFASTHRVAHATQAKVFVRYLVTAAVV